MPDLVVNRCLPSEAEIVEWLLVREGEPEAVNLVPTDLDFVLTATDSGTGTNRVNVAKAATWTTGGNMDGLGGDSDNLGGMDYDSVNQKGYLGNISDGEIQSFTFTQVSSLDHDAENITLLISGEGSDELFAVVVDRENGKIWWIKQGASTGNGIIRRADLADGANKETIFTASGIRLRGMQLDLDNDVAYCAGGPGGTGSVYKVEDLSGTPSITKLEDSTSVQWLGADFTNGYLYYGDAGSPDLLVRWNIALGQRQGTLEVPSMPAGVKVDVANGKVYWRQAGGLYRCDLDLSNAEELINENLVPRDICLVFGHPDV